jgi:predicted dienelactone hydrolase
MWWLLAGLALAAAGPGCTRHEAGYAAPGHAVVRVVDGTLRDATRSRDVPYRMFRPLKLDGTHPVVIYSHGNGGSRFEAAYLGRHLASRGYIVVHIQHAGSDAAIWAGLADADAVAGRMKAAAADPAVHRARYEDVRFVLDELAAMNAADPELAGHLDLNAIGMSGHSWGALTTLVSVGALNGLDAPSYKDTRIKAAVALSPSLPRIVDERELATACSGISVPMLHVTGTLDSSPVVPGLTYEKRMGAYRAISAPHQHLLVLEGADHMVMPGVDGPLRRIGPEDAKLLRAIRASTLAFWDAYLRGSADARHWLQVTYPASGDPVVHSLASK